MQSGVRGNTSERLAVRSFNLSLSFGSSLSFLPDPLPFSSISLVSSLFSLLSSLFSLLHSCSLCSSLLLSSSLCRAPSLFPSCLMRFFCFRCLPLHTVMTRLGERRGKVASCQDEQGPSPRGASSQGPEGADPRNGGRRPHNRTGANPRTGFFRHPTRYISTQSSTPCCRRSLPVAMGFADCLSEVVGIFFYLDTRHFMITSVPPQLGS